MRIKNIFLGLTILPILIASCCKVDNLEVFDHYSKRIRVDLNAIDQSNDHPLAAHFSSCSYIQLETNPKSIIGKINKVVVANEKIYILDISITRSLFIFDQYGKWERTISRHGRGPQEYIELTDFFLDSIDNTLNLVCPANKKIMKFNLDGNRLIREEQIPIVTFAMDQNRQGDYFGCSYNTPGRRVSANIIILDSLFRIKNIAFPISESWKSNQIGLSSPLSKYKGDIYYAEAITNKIYRCTKDSIHLCYEFDFGEASISKKLENSYLNNTRAFNRRYILRQDYVQITEQFIFSSFIWQGTSVLLICDKEEHVPRLYSLSDNPILPDFISFGRIVSIDPETIITYLSPTTVQRRFSRTDLAYRFVKQLAFLRSQIHLPIKEDDNPILCIYHLN